MDELMNRFDYLALFPKLEKAINNELNAWAVYLDTLKEQGDYDAIISHIDNDPTQPLQYLLHVLPARHAILAHAYKDPGLSKLDVSAACLGLLRKLAASAKQEVPITAELPDKTQADGSARAASTTPNLNMVSVKTLTGKQVLRKVQAIEKILSEEEEGRAMELHRLKCNFKAMEEVHADGELDSKDVITLIDVMDEMGVGLEGSGIIEEILGTTKYDQTMLSKAVRRATGN